MFLFFEENGHLRSFGQNEKGQLGIGSTQSASAAKVIKSFSTVETISCGPYYSFATLEDESFYGFGMNEDGHLCLGNTKNQTSPQKIAFSGVLSVSCGNHFTFVTTK